ncbi:MAG: hypothetical protein WC679_13255 [Bacteroidales bacterium]|jgi:hypothetical protein
MKKIINKYLLNFNGYWKAVHLIGFIILLVLLIIKGYSGLIEFSHPIDIHAELPQYEQPKEEKKEYKQNDEEKRDEYNKTHNPHDGEIEKWNETHFISIDCEDEEE